MPRGDRRGTLDVMAWLTTHVYALAFVASVIDAMALPFPGRVLLVVAGAIAARGEADVAIVIGLAAAGAVIGDHVWYAIGRLTGRGPLRLVCRLARESRKRCETRSRNYYRRWGGAAIILGRFVAGVRVATTPLVAHGDIPYLRYLGYEILGALIWASTFVLVGYGLGPPAFRLMQHWGWTVGLGIASGIGVLAVPVARRWLRTRSRLARPVARA